jgi:hypothetical protein
MQTSRLQRALFGLINIPIGIGYGIVVFSLIPMFYGLFGTLITVTVLFVIPRAGVWLVVVVYWLAFSVMLFMGQESWRSLLIEPFRDLDHWRQ